MSAYKIQFIETLVSIVVLFLIVEIVGSIIVRVGKKFAYQRTRILIIKKAVTFSIYIIFLGIFLLIWGIAPSQLTGYLASLFAVIGVAFFAQWSIASNITSTLIIFFNRHIKIGDHISILDKEYQIEGKVHDIGIFFIILKTENDEYVSLPSNVFMHKMIRRSKD